MDAERRSSARAKLAALAVMSALVGCRGAGETTDMMVPWSWHGNPWGPQANAARETGEIPVVPNNPNMDAWTAWARANLRDGDLVFRMGNARAFFGLMPFSRFSAAVAGSKYSHSGIVAIENGEPVVYDTSTGGPQRQPFAIWLLDATGAFAIKRPRLEYQQHASQAVAYCRNVYDTQVPFDTNMKLGDDKLYCIELTQRAYASSGLELSQSLRLDHLPRYHEFPKVVALVKVFTAMHPDQKAYIIGNEKLGIWSSPALETVYEAPNARPPQTLMR